MLSVKCLVFGVCELPGTAWRGREGGLSVECCVLRVRNVVFSAQCLVFSV